MQETERINPEHCNAPYNLGTTLLRAGPVPGGPGALSRALVCYEREGRVGAYIADTHYNLGVALSSLGRYPEAESHFRTCLQIAPNYPGARIALGNALARQGKAISGHPEGRR